MVLAGRFAMAPLVCKHCGSASFVRNGMAHGHRRSRCRACGRNFTATPPRGKPPAMKALAVLLYALGNVSQGMIAKLLGAATSRSTSGSGRPARARRRLRLHRRAASSRSTRCGISWTGKNKVWLWRAFDPVARRTLAWELGGRDDATCRRLLDKVGLDGHVFVTDEWEGFQRLIPQEQLFTGKDLTFPIEQDDSNIRHHLARFRRRSKVTSRARHMVDGALRLLCHLRQPENFLPMRDSFLSVFG